MNRDDYEYTIVAASDGIWDAISVAEARDYLLIDFGDLSEVCAMMVERARDKWLSVSQCKG